MEYLCTACVSVGLISLVSPDMSDSRLVVRIVLPPPHLPLAPAGEEVVDGGCAWGLLSARGVGV